MRPSSLTPLPGPVNTEMPACSGWQWGIEHEPPSEPSYAGCGARKPVSPGGAPTGIGPRQQTVPPTEPGSEIR